MEEPLLLQNHTVEEFVASSGVEILCPYGPDTGEPIQGGGYGEFSRFMTLSSLRGYVRGTLEVDKVSSAGICRR